MLKAVRDSVSPWALVGAAWLIMLIGAYLWVDHGPNDARNGRDPTAQTRMSGLGARSMVWVVGGCE